MQESSLWEGGTSRVHRCPEVRLRPTRPLHGARLRTELKGGVNRSRNGILERQQTGPGQGESGLKMVGAARMHSACTSLDVHLVRLALCRGLET